LQLRIDLCDRARFDVIYAWHDVLRSCIKKHDTSV
jgi:hypothetical protein